ncbi:hypothetical protein B0T24DRAFT_255257 [Lasiosphaeria ovina]|uniref:Uncharacterized protein n=1 Tax=Lasiosphaeria ovina TaxID=92902 RepID=A0AAE0N7N1_9PEZI|nr:hypothetical protein B0T24DRAFT_255257 [Lasiosphaeria ovina]
MHRGPHVPSSYISWFAPTYFSRRATGIHARPRTNLRLCMQLCKNADMQTCIHRERSRKENLHLMSGGARNEPRWTNKQTTDSSMHSSLQGGRCSPEGSQYVTVNKGPRKAKRREVASVRLGENPRTLPETESKKGGNVLRCYVAGVKQARLVREAKGKSNITSRAKPTPRAAGWNGHRDGHGHGLVSGYSESLDMMISGTLHVEFDALLGKKGIEYRHGHGSGQAWAKG